MSDPIDFGAARRRKDNQDMLIQRVVGIKPPNHVPKDTDCPLCGSDQPEHDAEFCPRTACPYSEPEP